MERRTPQPAEQDSAASTRLQQVTARAQRALGAAGATLALLGAAEPAAAADKQPVGASPENHSYAEGMPKPNHLSGYNQVLAPEARESLANATVKIARRFKGGDGTWQQQCTGVKVSTASGTYISTAAHCFKDFSSVSQNGNTEGTADQPKAFNIFSNIKDFNEFAVFDPKQPKAMRQPLAIIDGISINNRVQDRALLSVVPSEASSNSPDFRTFDQIESVPLATEQKHAVPRPKPGQRVALFGVPQANGDRQTAGLGRYLGRVKFIHPNGTLEYQDVVGIKPKLVNQDTCNFGASGSSFSTTVGKQTYLSGPLSRRINALWDPQYVDTNLDFTDGRGDLTNEIENSARAREDYQLRLNVDLSSFSTICGYAVNLPGTNRDMIEGFQHEPPYVPYLNKGGTVGFDSGKGGDGGDEFVSMK